MPVFFNRFTDTTLSVDSDAEMQAAIDGARKEVLRAHPSVAPESIFVFSTPDGDVIMTFAVQVHVTLASGRTVPTFRYPFMDVIHNTVDLAELAPRLKKYAATKPFALDSFTVRLANEAVTTSWSRPLSLSRLGASGALEILESAVKTPRTPRTPRIPPPKTPKTPTPPLRTKPSTRSAAEAAAAAAAANNQIGAGSFGCVIEKPVTCAGPDAAVDVPVHAFNGLRKAGRVFKIQEQNDSLWKFNTEVLLRIDPRSAFLLPFESMCRVADLDDVADCKPIQYSVRPIVQLSMRRGVDMHKAASWLPLLKTHDELTVHIIEAFVDLFDGCALLCEHGIVHGDIKPANILYFPQDSKFRLIDYDFMSSFYFMSLSRQLDMETTFSRTGLAAYLRDNVGIDTVLRNFDDDRERFAFAVSSYFPAENILAYMCAVSDVKYQTQTPDWTKFSKFAARMFDEKCVQPLQKMFSRGSPRALRLFQMHLDLFKDGGVAYAQQFVDFVQDVVALNRTGTCASLFLDVYYPEKHDAFQLGYVLMQFMMQYDAAQNVVTSAVLHVANALLHPNPARRLSIDVAANVLRSLV